MVYYAPIYTWCVVCIEIYGRISNTKVHVCMVSMDIMDINNTTSRS